MPLIVTAEQEGLLKQNVQPEKIVMAMPVLGAHGDHGNGPRAAVATGTAPAIETQLRVYFKIRPGPEDP